MRRSWSAAIALSVLGAGCYVRSGLTTAPLPGASVRVILTPEAAAELADRIGPGAKALDGRVVSSTPDTLLLSVTRVLRQDEGVSPWRGERVALAQGALQSVEGRRFSTERTVVLGAALVAGLVAMGRAVIKQPQLPGPGH